jgi:hypothetical protein
MPGGKNGHSVGRRDRWSGISFTPLHPQKQGTLSGRLRLLVLNTRAFSSRAETENDLLL